MKSVWKYSLFMGLTEVDLPVGAEFLHVAEQGGIPQMWVLIDPEAPKETRQFEIRGTGSPVEEQRTWLGTWQSPPYVWHLFEIIQ